MRHIVAVALLFLSASAVRAEDCTTDKLPDDNNIIMNADVRGVGRFDIENKLKDKTEPVICLLTEKDFLTGGECGQDSLEINKQPPIFNFGLCKAGTSTFGTLTQAAITAADTIFIEFRPRTAGEQVQYLRLTGKDDAGNPVVTTYKLTGRAGVPDFAHDSRYKVWLYTGYTYLRTRNDFKDGYADLVMRVETRIIDAPVARGPNKGGPVMRLYGELGLTGTTIDSANAANTRVRQTFGGSFGIGGGRTFPVHVLDPTDTRAFTVMGVGRLGIISIPGVDADPDNNIPATNGSTAFNWSANVRVENERGGNFEGAYFEIGMGESEQFSQKKVPRLRADGLIPLGNGTQLFRFAGRLQLDTTRPFHKKENAEPAGDIRISILFNMDLQELAKRLGGK